MKEFICKVENMTEEELKNFINNLSSEECRQKLIDLIHHHLSETKKLYGMLDDVNEDKKAFREMFLSKKF